MRKPLLSLGLVALLVGACGSANNAASQGPRVAPPPPAHHAATQPPDQPPATPYDGVTFEDPGVNPFVDPGEDNQSTFALDVDTASYTVARRYIGDGNLPDPASVRVEEFVNYFDQGYEAPEDGTFAIHVDGGPSPFLALTSAAPGRPQGARRDRPRAPVGLPHIRHRRLGLDGPRGPAGSREAVARAPRRGAAARRHRRHRCLRLGCPGRPSADLGSRCRHDPRRDRLAPARRLDQRARPDCGSATRWPGRSSATKGSIESSSRPTASPTSGRPTPRRSCATSGDDAEAGIQLVSVGFGMGNFNDALLEQLADDGDGFYAYVDDLDEARRLFVEDLTGTLQSVALDARVRVEFSAEAVEAYRLVGFENRAIDDRDFRNDEVDAGAIGAGHAVTALYALRLSGEGGDQGRIGTVSLRWSDPVSQAPRRTCPRHPSLGLRRVIPGVGPDVQARCHRRRDGRALPGQPVGRDVQARRRRRGRGPDLREPAADPGGPRLPGAAQERPPTSNAADFPCVGRRPWRSGAGRRPSPSPLRRARPRSDRGAAAGPAARAGPRPARPLPSPAAARAPAPSRIPSATASSVPANSTTSARMLE